MLNLNDNVNPERLEGIDALRGLAVIMCFVMHCFTDLHNDGGFIADIYSGHYNHFFPNHFGALGVQLFFVISGFCIHLSTQTWIDNHPNATLSELWRNYGWRRFWRIAPLYLLVLLILWLLNFENIFTANSWFDLFVSSLMLQTLVPGHIYKFNPSFWTIAIEVQLYILYPLIWISMKRWGPIKTVFILTIFCLFLSIIIPKFWPFKWWSNMPFRWGYEWMLGVGVAVTLRRKWPSGLSIIILSIFLSILMLWSRVITINDIYSPVLFALLVGWAARQKMKFPSQLVMLGSISYAFYLVHQPVIGAVDKLWFLISESTFNTNQFFLAFLLSLFLCIVISLPLEYLGKIMLTKAKSKHG